MGSNTSNPNSVNGSNYRTNLALLFSFGFIISDGSPRGGPGVVLPLLVLELLEKEVLLLGQLLGPLRERRRPPCGTAERRGGGDGKETEGGGGGCGGEDAILKVGILVPKTGGQKYKTQGLRPLAAFKTLQIEHFDAFNCGVIAV